MSIILTIFNFIHIQTFSLIMRYESFCYIIISYNAFNSSNTY